MFCQNGERQLRRPTSAPRVKPEGRLPPHSKPVGLWLRSSRRGLRGFAFAVSVDNPNDTSLRTTAARVHLFTARAVSGSFGRRVHRAPFHGFENPARRPLRDVGARAPRPRITLAKDDCPTGARRERSRDGPLRRRERKRQHLSSLVPSCYRYVLAFIGLEVLPAAVRLTVRRTASCSLEEPWPHSGLIE
jgi:hypothetical protein